MNEKVVIGGETSIINVIDGDAELTLTADGVSGVVYEHSYAEEYTGEYTVIPSPARAKILETADKLMTDDVTVTQIPYFETSNQTGTTVFIANEV